MIRHSLPLWPLCIALALVSSASRASASTAQKPVAYIVIDKNAPRATLPIFPKETTALYFASGIDTVELSKQKLFHWATDAEVLVLQPRARAAGAARAAVRNRDYYAHFAFTLAERPSEARDFVVVLTPEQLEAMGEEEAEVQRELSHMRAGYEQRIAALEKTLKDRDTQIRDDKVLRAWQYMADSAQELRVVQRSSAAPAEGAPHVELSRAKMDGGDLHVQWKLHNPHAAPLHLHEVVHRTPRKPDREIDIVVAERPGFPGQEGAITTVPPGQSVEGVLVIPNVTARDMSPMDFLFISDSERILTAAGIEFYPLTDEEKAERERNRDAKGRIWLFAVGMVGAVWLANPLDDQEDAAATLWGGGLRTEYGFTRHLSAYVEGTGARSSLAKFGNLTRQATMGRAQAGGAVKMGQEIITSIRAGLGGHFVLSDIVGAAKDSDFEVGGFWTVGINLAVPLGPVQLGAGIMLYNPMDGDAQTFEFAIHAGGSWKPEAPQGR